METPETGDDERTDHDVRQLRGAPGLMLQLLGPVVELRSAP